MVGVCNIVPKSPFVLIACVAVHGRRRPFLRASCAAGSRRFCDHLLDQLLGVQVPTDVRLRVKDRKRWRE